jgi:hypothetical protein
MKLALSFATAAAFLSAPALADFAPGRTAAAPGWTPDYNFPSTPAIQRYGKGQKGLRRYARGLVREAEYRRWQQDAIAFRPAAARMEDARGRCDSLLKAALESGDQAEIESTRERCKPRTYGPYAR